MRLDTNAIFLLYKADRKHDLLIGPRLAILLPSGIEMPELAGRGAALFEIFKERLQSKDVVDHIVDVCCLDSDKFDDDESYKIKDVEYKDCGIVYTFVNDQENKVEVYFTFEDISVI